MNTEAQRDLRNSLVSGHIAGEMPVNLNLDLYQAKLYKGNVGKDSRDTPYL